MAFLSNTISYITIKEVTFADIVGGNLNDILAGLFKGDDWGSILKVSSVLESVTRRAIAKKLGLPLNHKSMGKIHFAERLTLCYDLTLISKEAYEYANAIRELRNNLAHTGTELSLDIEKMKGQEFYKKYVSKLQGFVAIANQSAEDRGRGHKNTLVMCLITFIAQIAQSQYGEDWLKPQ